MPSESETGLRHELQEEGACRRRLSLHLPAVEVEQASEVAARRLARRLDLPGFRRGRAPVAVVRARFAREVEEEAVEALATRHVTTALEERGLKPVSRPALQQWELKPGEPLRLELVFEVEATLRLAEYRGLAATRALSPVNDADVEQALEALRQGLARLRPVEERGAVTGDEVVLDLEAEHLGGPQTGERFERKGVTVELGGDELHPEMSGALAGARTGEEREVTIRYPEDYRTPALAGRALRYRLRLGAVRERQVPEWSDELARELGDVAGMEDLRVRVREDLVRGRSREAEEGVRQQIIRQLLERHPFEVPESLVELEVRPRLGALARELVARGIDPETSGLDWGSERERAAKRAVEEIRAARILDAVAEQESIDAREEDVEAFFAGEARRSGRSTAAIRARWEKEGRIPALRAHLRRDRVLDFLVSVGHIQEREE